MASVSFSAQVYKVLIASPSDTSESRAAIQQAIVEWNDLNAEGFGAVLLPVMWEMSATPSIGASPQAILNDQIVDDADVVIAVFWTRLGTRTEHEPSGSVEEIRRKAGQGAPVLLYFLNQPAANPLNVDTLQLKAVQDFKTEMQGIAVLGDYETNKDLLHYVQRDLTRVIRKLQSGGDGPTNPPQPSSPAPSGGTAVDIGQDLERILNSYKDELRGLLARQRVRFESATPESDPDGARRVMVEYASALSQMVGAVAALSSAAANSRLNELLIDMTRRSTELGHLRMYLDGGQSLRKLVDGSEGVFSGTSELLEQNWVELIETPKA
jgi:hypothetical protein